MDANDLARLARATAVLGCGTQLGIAAQLAGLDMEAAERAADALAAAGVLAPARPLRFAQLGLREAVYGDMAPGARAIAHRRAVRLLAGSGAAAAHALAVEPAHDTGVAEALIAAGRDALATGEPELAVPLLERALREPPPPPWQAVARALLGVALGRLGSPRAPGLLRDAALVEQLVDALWLRGDAAAAIEALGTPAGLAAAEAARTGTAPAAEIAELALSGLHGATAFERCSAVAALIACDRPEIAARALAQQAATARARGACAELRVIERLWRRIETIASGMPDVAAPLPGPDPGAAPWEAWLDQPALVDRFGTPSARAAALRARGGIDALERAVAVLRSSPRRAALAEALVDLGRALRHAGRRAAARPVLREALDLAQRLELVERAAQAREELQVAGARPRREFLSGPDSLTASERRVADAAAAGLSNRDIAAQLFLSPKTVEMHLGRVYRKLDIRSRAELSLAA